MKSIICAIVKNEQRFIREWVEWHLNVGFSEIHIFEDFGSKSHAEQLADLIESGKVFLTALESGEIPVSRGGYTHRRNVKPTQYTLYDWFFKKTKREASADWIAFIDVDEFICFEEGYDLDVLEEEYADKGGVLLSWRQYGANGHIKRPKGGVVASYTGQWEKPREGSQWGHKSLVNVKVSKGFESVHSFQGCKHTDGGDKYGKQCYDKAWINHYFTKSWEDWCERIFSRGNMQNNYRTLDTFFKYNADMRGKKEELIMSVRYRHTAATTWLSRDLKLVSGGNERRISDLRQKYSNKFLR